MKWSRPPPVSLAAAIRFLAAIALLCFGSLAALGLFAYLLEPGLRGLIATQADCFDSERPGEKTLLAMFRFIDSDGVDIAVDPGRRRRLMCDRGYRPHSVFAGLLWIAPDRDGRDQAPFFVGPSHEKPLAFLAARVDRIRFVETGNVECERPKLGAFYNARDSKSIDICPHTAAEDVLWLPLLMHEARHADAKPHVACSRGLITWPQGCDKSFTEYGAYRISYEVARDISRSASPEAWVRRAAAAYALADLLEHFTTLSPDFLVKTGAYVISGGTVHFFDGNRLDDLGGVSGVYLSHARGRMPRNESIVVIDREGRKAFSSSNGKSFRATARQLARAGQILLDQSFGSDAQGEDVACRLERKQFSCVPTANPDERLALDLPFEAEHLLFKGDPRLSMEQLPFVGSAATEDPMVKRLTAGRFPGGCIALVSSTGGDIYAIHREGKDMGRLIAEKVDSGHGILAAGSVVVDGKPRTMVLRSDHRVYLYDENGTAGNPIFDGREVDDLVLPEIWTDAPGD